MSRIACPIVRFMASLPYELQISLSITTSTHSRSGVSYRSYESEDYLMRCTTPVAFSVSWLLDMSMSSFYRISRCSQLGQEICFKEVMWASSKWIHFTTTIYISCRCPPLSYLLFEKVSESEYLKKCYFVWGRLSRYPSFVLFLGTQ